MSNMPPFESFDLSGLVLAYNELARELREKFGQSVEDRKSFRNKSSGLEACKALWAKIPNTGTQQKESVMMSEDTSNIPAEGEAVASAENPAPQKGRKKAPAKPEKAAKADKPEKAAKADKPARGTKAPAKPEKAPKAAKEPKAPTSEPKKTGDGRGRAPRYGEKDKITVLVDGNPKRPGSIQAQMWEGYKGNPTIKTFKERLAKMGYDEKAARSRLYFDVDRGFVSVGE